MISLQLESLYIGAGVLGLSFLSESVTLGIAINSIRESSKNENMTFFEYVYGGYDPSVNVVLLEDFAAVVGVAIGKIYWQKKIPWNRFLPFHKFFGLDI